MGTGQYLPSMAELVVVMACTCIVQKTDYYVNYILSTNFR